MNKNELIMLQALPLEVKIMKTKQRIREWIDYHGSDKVYISFSGGKDSTVLYKIVHEIDNTIPLVFCDTGLEYPEIKEFVKETFNKLEKDVGVIIRPNMCFKEVIDTYGYPIISKEQSNYLYEIRNGTEKLKNLRLYGDKNGNFKLSKKWHYLIDAPFKISHKCCIEMKKKPFKKYERKTKRKPIVGNMASESSLREQSYLRYGCNTFNKSREISMPLGFWTNQDILLYLKENNINIAKCYGDIMLENNILKTTLCDRTGCVFCGFGVHLEKGKNRYQRLEETHPKLHNYCINNLGFKEVLEYMNIQYKNNV